MTLTLSVFHKPERTHDATRKSKQSQPFIKRGREGGEGREGKEGKGGRGREGMEREGRDREKE